MREKTREEQLADTVRRQVERIASLEAECRKHRSDADALRDINRRHVAAYASLRERFQRLARLVGEQKRRNQKANAA